VRGHDPDHCVVWARTSGVAALTRQEAGRGVDLDSNQAEP
jgi:hypothetical protein